MRRPPLLVPAALLLLGSLAGPSNAQEIELTWDALRHRWVDARITIRAATRPLITVQRPWHPTYRPRVAPTNRPCLPPPPPSCGPTKSCAPTCEPQACEPAYEPCDPWRTGRTAAPRAVTPRREAPRCEQPAPRCEQPAPRCEPADRCETADGEDPWADRAPPADEARGPREWREQSPRPVAPREWRTPLSRADLQDAHRALFEDKEPEHQIATLAYLAGQHTLTVDQAITLVAAIERSADRREALFVIHGSVCDAADFTRTYALLEPCDQDLLHVRINEPFDGRGFDGRRTEGQRRRTWGD